MEMLLQSWDGCIRLFPGLPAELDTSFENFRTRGAFLVSAGRLKGMVQSFTVFSEKGGNCIFQSPWENAVVTDSLGNAVPLQKTAEGNYLFSTNLNTSYSIMQSNRKDFPHESL